MPADDRDPDRIFDVALASDDIAFWEDQGGESQSLVELINRVLDRGVVITGDVTLSVAGVDLVYLGLSAVLTSVATARERVDRNVGSHHPGRAPRAG
jgi:gas vesicle structural protein